VIAQLPSSGRITFPIWRYAVDCEDGRLSDVEFVGLSNAITNSKAPPVDGTLPKSVGEVTWAVIDVFEVM
jgi:hypothetical protein